MPVALEDHTESKLKRFTLDGSDELEALLRQLCTHISERVARLVPEGKLEALVLGGGYGRGEGGVLTTDAGERPYNDLEFYIFLRGERLLNQKKYQPAFDIL